MILNCKIIKKKLLKPKNQIIESDNEDQIS